MPSSEIVEVFDAIEHVVLSLVSGAMRLLSRALSVRRNGHQRIMVQYINVSNGGHAIVGDIGRNDGPEIHFRARAMQTD